MTEIISKNILIMEALKKQNAWMIKFELKKNISYSSNRFNIEILPELLKIFPEHVLNETEIRSLYQEEFIIKKNDKYQEIIKIWKDIPKIESFLKNEIIEDKFFIICTLINKEGDEIKNNK